MGNIISKSAKIKSLEITEDELMLINKQTIKELDAKNVFIFKISACNNDIDRDFEMFTTQALDKLSKLLVGKTILTDHRNESANQCARIYKSYVVENNNLTKSGELFSELICHCYTLNSDNNKNFIAEIEAGIKKEVSIGCRISTVTCSICGSDNCKSYCQHIGGKIYEEKQCFFKLEDPTDAYEVSFVAIPSQPYAGVKKAYGGEPEQNQVEKTPAESLNAKIKCEEIFIFIENEKEKTHEQKDEGNT